MSEKATAVVKEIVSTLFTVGVTLLVMFLLYTHVGYAITISGDSMYPTLQDGDKMLMSKVANIDRFDIVVVDSPDETEKYIKRVIGMPGDTIKMEKGILYINGKEVDQPFINKDLPEKEKTVFLDDFTLERLTKEEKVPEGQYFVMGDNRGVSKDSRMIGFIPEEHVLGEAVFTFWGASGLDKVGVPTNYHNLYSE